MSETQNDFSNFLDHILPSKFPALLRDTFYVIVHKNRKLEREWFSDRVHYHYFMRFVLPKLRSKRTEKYIFVSESYMVLTFRDPEYNLYSYVIGVDSDKALLFVNRIVSLLDVEGEAVSFNDITIARTEDLKIREILGYNRECEDVIDGGGRIRVQGEIVLNVFPCIESNTRERLFSRLSEQLKVFMGDLALDTVCGVLLEMGYSPRIIPMSENHRIIVDMPKVRAEDFANQLSKFLAKYFDYVDVKGYIIDIKDDDFGELSINIYSNDYQTQIHSASCKSYGRLAHKILTELKEATERTEPATFNFYIGNHSITLKNAYSLRSEFIPSVQPLFLNRLRLALSRNIFIVDTDSELTVTHREHGTRKLRFARTFEIWFSTLNVHEHYQDERNYLVYSLINRSLIRRNRK